MFQRLINDINSPEQALEAKGRRFRSCIDVNPSGHDVMKVGQVIPRVIVATICCQGQDEGSELTIRLDGDCRRSYGHAGRLICDLYIQLGVSHASFDTNQPYRSPEVRPASGCTPYQVPASASASVLEVLIVHH